MGGNLWYFHFSSSVWMDIALPGFDAPSPSYICFRPAVSSQLVLSHLYQRASRQPLSAKATTHSTQRRAQPKTSASPSHAAETPSTHDPFRTLHASDPPVTGGFIHDKCARSIRLNARSAGKNISSMLHSATTFTPRSSSARTASPLLARTCVTDSAQVQSAQTV